MRRIKIILSEGDASRGVSKRDLEKILREKMSGQRNYLLILLPDSGKILGERGEFNFNQSSSEYKVRELLVGELSEIANNLEYKLVGCMLTGSQESRCEIVVNPSYQTALVKLRERDLI